jgi:hypothetical protein
MGHGQIIQFRTGTAYQCGAGIDEGVRFHGEGSWEAGRAIRYLQESSLPVCAQSSDHGQRGSSSGPEDSFYHQIVAGSNSKNSALRELYRQEFKRYSVPGTGGLSPWHSWAWVRAEDLQPEESSWNTVLIGCQTRKSSKLISFL